MAIRFAQIDRITKIEAWSFIEAVKSLTLSEEYLRDHFPCFPVMPGVLMLEGLYQAASWLIRYSDDFRLPSIVLREARNVKYSGFVLPGDTLNMRAEVIKRDGVLTTLKVSSTVGENAVVSGRLIVEQYDLSQRYSKLRGRATVMQEQELREDFSVLFPFQQPPESRESGETTQDHATT